MRGTQGLLGAAVATALAIATTGVVAQDIGSAGRGLELAKRLCAECHAIYKEEARSPVDDAPHFQLIALVPGMTALALSATLNTSHRAMPNILLKPEEQADLIAYILSLK